MKFPSRLLGGAVAWTVGLSLATSAWAEVTDAEFEALKKTVEQLKQQLDSLQSTHQKDQTQIQDLKTQLGETQTAVTNAQQSADAAVSKVESAMTPGRSATHDFMVVGDAEVQFGKSQGQHNTFQLADFAPIFLFRGGERTLFEAGFDVTLANNVDANGKPNGGSSTSIGLSFAQLDYVLHDNVTLVAGDMLLPLGTYSERAAGWLNKIPDDPFSRDLLPGSGVGAQLRGAFPVGVSGQSFNYALYGINGPSSIDGTGRAGSLDLGGNVGDTPNLHAAPAGGGRLGWFFPWKPHYDFELGLSGQTGVWDNAGKRLWSAANLDATLHLGPAVEIKGEYINTWYETDDRGTLHPNGGWVQAGYKLSGLSIEAPIINNVELVGRYDRSNDTLGTKVDRGTVGFVYYFSNTLLLEGDLEFLRNHGDNRLPSNKYVLQLSYGF